MTEADLYEQRRDLVDDPVAASDVDEANIPDDVDPADAQEQRLVVDYDEDEYR